ncbi:LSM4 U6 small nuclear RNA and mRNA degradation-associated [Fasciola gigantica]|uniref:U6 snRNA-associated Sm-like protein LSm4 n=1 Tax=Fasciola gigantica TaxID=46835 RepID=A0A504YEY4_FASGI|nr:LSM4 U6 small nuclear RNA and mRNA degradation-associated [Fasciola gigantica]
MLVELKSGETYNGHLVACDDWMNVHLKEVICTSRDGDRFWKMPECYIRGSIIKYLRIPDDVIDKVKEDMQLAKARNRSQSGDATGRGGFNRNKGRGKLWACWNGNDPLASSVICKLTFESESMNFKRC